MTQSRSLAARPPALVVICNVMCAYMCVCVCVRVVLCARRLPLCRFLLLHWLDFFVDVEDRQTKH